MSRKDTLARGDASPDVRVTLAPSATANGMDIYIQAIASNGEALAGVHQLELWMSESSLGLGLTADTYSGALTAVKGSVLTAYTAKKHISAVTDANGLLQLLLVDTAKPADQFVAVRRPFDGGLIVSQASGSNWQGASAITLTLSGTLAFSSATTAGTEIATISNVPAGATPVLSPNDGRLVIAGSEGAWRVVVGLTAVSAGVIPLSVGAVGAKSAEANVTVTTSGGGGFTGPLAKWKTALAAQQAGTRNAKILVIGDSTVAGAGANGTGGVSNARAVSWPTVFADALNTGGITASWQSIFGKARTDAGSVVYSAYDTRVSLGTGWDTTTSFLTLGEKPFGSGTANTGTKLSFTPTIPVDTFEFTYITSTNGSQFSYDVNDGTATNVNATAASSIVKVTVNTTLGTNTINFKRLAGGTDAVRIASVVGYNSAAKEVSVYNAGWIGALAADFASSTNAYSPIPAIAVHQPDLTIICLTANDAYANTNMTTYKASIQTIIDAAKVYGDVLLCIGAQQQTTGPSQAQQDPFNTAMADLTTLNNLAGVVDFRTPLGANWAAANSAGFMRDGAHPNASGYAVMGAYMRTRLLALAA